MGEVTFTEQPGGPSSDGALDRSKHPGIPAIVADIWDGYLPTGDEAADAATALQMLDTMVNSLSGGGRRFSVTLDPTEATAGTDLRNFKVAVTAAALYDQRLTLLERLGVTTGMAHHESGHGRITGPMAKAVEKAWRGSLDQPNALRLSNYVEDERLEADHARRYPAYGPLFALTMWWVANRYPSGYVDRLPSSRDEVLNFALAAIRYGPHTEWSADPAIEAERVWWVDWAHRAASTDKPKVHVERIAEALAHMAHLPMQAPQPSGEGQPEPGDQGDEPGGDEQPQTKSQTQGVSPHPFRPMAALAEFDRTDVCADCGLPADDAVHAEVEQPEPQDGEGEGEGQGDDESEDESEDGEGDGEGEDGDEPDESDESEPGNAPSDQPGDEDGDEPGQPTDDDGSEADGDEVTYKHRDEADESAKAGQPKQGDTISYGPTGQQPDEDREKGKQRDWLTDPLPLHPTDALTADDRNRDLLVQRTVNTTAHAEGMDVVSVTHPGGHVEKVIVARLDTERVRMGTDPAVQGALRQAFTARRTARDDRHVARSGRLSGTRAYRVRTGSANVFTRRDGISPDRLDVHLLVDASGSMGTTAYGGDWRRDEFGNWKRPVHATVLEHAAKVAANLTEALARVQTVRVHVWAHNTDGDTRVWDVYDSRRAEPLARIAGIETDGGNNDASAIAAVANLIEKGRTNRERSILLVLSDGAPCEAEHWVRSAVDSARERGIGVGSVAIAGGLTQTQIACFGAEDVIGWNQDWDRLAREMAVLIGRMA